MHIYSRRHFAKQAEHIGRQVSLIEAQREQLTNRQIGVDVGRLALGAAFARLGSSGAPAPGGMSSSSSSSALPNASFISANDQSSLLIVDEEGEKIKQAVN